jgi:hypothetical protein
MSHLTGTPQQQLVQEGGNSSGEAVLEVAATVLEAFSEERSAKQEWRQSVVAAERDDDMVWLRKDVAKTRRADQIQDC